MKMIQCNCGCGKQQTREVERRHNNIDVAEKRRTKAQERIEIVRAENRILLLEYLSSHPCVDCSESDPILLEFHHVLPKLSKNCTISNLLSRGKSWTRILEEIAKCVVVCKNCHLLRHNWKFKQDFQYIMDSPDRQWRKENNSSE